MVASAIGKLQNQETIKGMFNIWSDTRDSSVIKILIRSHHMPKSPTHGFGLNFIILWYNLNILYLTRENRRILFPIKYRNSVPGFGRKYTPFLKSNIILEILFKHFVYLLDYKLLQMHVFLRYKLIHFGRLIINILEYFIT